MTALCHYSCFPQKTTSGLFCFSPPFQWTTCRHAHNASRNKQRRGFLKQFLTTVVCLQWHRAFIHNQDRFQGKVYWLIVVRWKTRHLHKIGLFGGNIRTSFFKNEWTRHGQTGRKMSRCGRTRLPTLYRKYSITHLSNRILYLYTMGEMRSYQKVWTPLAQLLRTSYTVHGHGREHHVSETMIDTWQRMTARNAGHNCTECLLCYLSLLVLWVKHVMINIFSAS